MFFYKIVVMKEEYIDILNEFGEPLNYSASRTEVHSKGLWHRTVHIWVFDYNGNVLFQKRSLKKENHPGLLDTSCAGHISAGDDSRNAGIRELSEELNVFKKREDLKYLFESKHESILNNGAYLDNEYYDIYRTEISSEEIAKLSPQKSEVDSLHWFSLNEFEALLQKEPSLFVNHPEDFNYLKQVNKSL